MSIGFSRFALPWLIGAAFAFAFGCGEQQAHPETPNEALEANASEEADMDASALDHFRQPLEPYGRWVDDTPYGTVWVPNPEAVGSDFAPYVTAGHWALTEDDQWMWVSDYEWGWATFHYGRWVWIDGTGWAWIPGAVYAPAWVVWQTGYYDDAYVGWAPMPPLWYWRAGVVVRVGAAPPARYVFVPSRYVFRPGWRTYIAADARVSAVAAHMQPYSAAGRTHYQALAIARGPAPAAARVPADAMPAQRAAPDARATSFGARSAGPARAPARAAPSRGRSRGGGGHHGR